MEPRARVSRHKGTLNFPDDLRRLLFAYGAPSNPYSTSYEDAIYPETLRCLDDITTDFIIETCHNAVSVANLAGRQKLKLDDFLFALRKDEKKLGRVQLQFERKKEIEDAKKGFDSNVLGGEGKKLAVEDLEVLAGEVGEEGTGKGKGRGRGRKKRKVDADDDINDDGKSAVSAAGKKRKKAALADDA